MQSMDDYDFEHFVAGIWENYGFRTSVTQQSNDMGLDVRAVNPDTGEKHLIQAKRYGPDVNVGGPEVQQYASLFMHESQVTDVWIVTTGGFTDAARETADHYGVKLADGSRLLRMVEEIKEETGKALLNSLVDPKPGDGPTVRWKNDLVYTIPEHSFVGELLWFAAGGVGALLVLAGAIGFLIALSSLEYAIVATAAITLVFGGALYSKARKEIIPRRREE